MKKLLGLAGLVLLGLAALPGRAQVFRPGWVLPVQGDTLRGEVEDDGWNDAPEQVRFRPAAGAASQPFAPAELRAFRLVGGRYFRSETLPLDRNAVMELGALPYALVRNPKSETFLAEVLVDGPATLLRTAVNNVQHYYVRRPGQPVLELAERSYLSQVDGRQVVRDGNNYRAELGQYFGDCPAAVRAIGLFQMLALVEVVQTYNRQCSSSLEAGVEYHGRGQRAAIGFALGVVAGGRYGSCQLQAQDAGTTFDGTNLDGVVHPVGGAYLDLLLPGRQGALHLAALFTRLGREGTVAVQGGGPTPQLNNQLSIVEFRLGGRIFFGHTQHENRFFAGSGLTVGYAFGYRYPTLTYYPTSARPLSAGDVPEPYPHSILLPYLEIGMQHERLTLQLDARTQSQGIVSLSSVPAAATYPNSTESYAYRNWYLGATVGLALLRRQ